MVCRNCGNPLVPDALFCGVCGTRVAVENPAAPVAAAVEETVQSAAAAVEETVQPAVAAVEETVAPVAAAAEAPAAAVEEIAAPVAAAVEENVQTAAESVAAPVVETAAPIVEAAAPAATAVEAVKAAAEETVPPVYQQPVAPAAPEAPAAPQPVYQQPVYQQPAAPAAPQAAPEAPAAPQQPVYQQPVYQQPVAPGMPQAAPQAGQQPVYQQPGFPQAAPQQGFPQQPVYAQPGYPQQPVFQQPAPAKKKKSKAPVIIISILLILLILAGSGIAYLTFFDKNGEKNYFGIDLNVLDFTQLSDSEEKAFLEKIETIDEAFAEVNARKFKKALPDFAVKYACEIFGAKDVPTLLEDSYEKYLEEACGEVSSVSEKAYLKYEIDSPKKLAESVEELMGEEVTMKKAYLVENVSKYKGDKGTKSMSDLYIFYNDGEEWNVILIDESTVEKLNID